MNANFLYLVVFCIVSQGHTLSTSNPSDNNVGEILFGGLDEEIIEKRTLSSSPVTEKYPWQITIDKVTMEDGPTLCEGGCQGWVDTATSFIVGPTRDIERINIALGRDQGLLNSIPDFDYDSIMNRPNFTFTINGQDLQLNGEDYVLKVISEDGVRFMSGFMGMDLPENTWILGHAFIKNFYTVFDEQRNMVWFSKLDDKQKLTKLQ